MGTVDDFILSIKNKEGLKFDGQVADLINIDRRVLANYKHKDSLPFKLQEWYCDRYDIEIKDFHKKIKLTNADIQLEGEGDMDARYVIELQKDKIQSVEKELVEVNTQLDYIKQSPVQSELWEQIVPDFQTTVEIKPKLNVFAIGMLLRQVKVIGSEVWAESLGISPQQILDYHDIGVWHEWGKSPIEEIIVESSRESISKEIPTLEKIIDFLKNLAGDHYYNQTVVYSYNKKVVVTHCASKIKWWNSPKTVLTKNTILKVEDIE